MIAIPMRGGWQTIMADLALILFMVTAAALAERPQHSTGRDAPEPLRAEPVAIYRPVPGAVSLSGWLAGQSDDGRLRATVVARGTPSPRLVAAGLALADQAQAAGWPARIVIEPAQGEDVSLVLAYDADPVGMAVAKGADSKPAQQPER